MSAVILADNDPLYAWFVTETLQRVGVPVTWFRSAGPAVAFAAAGAGDRLLLVDASTWLANPAPAAGPRAHAPAVLLGWESERRPPEGFVVAREKPGDTDVLCRLVAEASAPRPAGAAAGERSPDGAR